MAATIMKERSGRTTRRASSTARKYFGSALVGYQFHSGARLIVKLFAGIESDSQIISPHDPNNSVRGSALGVKLLAEGWSDLSERYYLSADASYGSAFQGYRALARLGFRARPRLSLGLEGGVVGNEEYVLVAVAASRA